MESQQRCSSTRAIRQAALVAQALMVELKLMRSAWSFQAPRPSNLGNGWDDSWDFIIGIWIHDDIWYVDGWCLLTWLVVTRLCDRSMDVNGMIWESWWSIPLAWFKEQIYGKHASFIFFPSNTGVPAILVPYINKTHERLWRLHDACDGYCLANFGMMFVISYD